MYTYLYRYIYPPTSIYKLAIKFIATNYPKSEKVFPLQMSQHAIRALKATFNTAIAHLCELLGLPHACA